MVHGVDYVGTFVGRVPREGPQLHRMPLCSIVASPSMVKGGMHMGGSATYGIYSKDWTSRPPCHIKPRVTEINGLNGVNRHSAESESLAP
jgi:hypothetical protein